MAISVDTHRVRAGDGIMLHVEVAGDGPTVVLVAGLGLASWWWSPLRHRLGSDFRVIAFDNRGSGLSDKPDGPYSMAQFAEDTLAVVDRLGEPPVHMVGVSMGGSISLTLAHAHPQVVRSLTLLGTTPGGTRAPQMPEATVQAVAGAAPAEMARVAMRLSFAPGWTDAHPAEFEELVASWHAGPTPPHAWRRQFDAAVEYYRRGIDVESISQPALVVHGTEDRVVPYPNAELLVERMPNAELLRLDGAGHYALLERPAQVGEAIVEFLAREPTRLGKPGSLS